MLKPLALGALLFALGTGLGWVLAAPRAGSVSASSSPVSDDRMSEELRALRDSIEELRRDLGERSSTAPAASPPSRDREVEAVTPTGERTPVASGPSLADVAAQIAALEQAVAALRDAAAKGASPARIPSYELIRRGSPVPDWNELRVLIEDRRPHGPGTVSPELLASLKWRSQEEVLLTFGRPTKIFDDGRWLYDGKEEPAVRGHVIFRFLEDYVATVEAYAK